MQLCVLYVTCQIPLPMGLSQQENWSGLPRDQTTSSALAGEFSITEPPRKPKPEKLGTEKVTHPVLLNKKLISSISTFQKGHVEYKNYWRIPDNLYEMADAAFLYHTLLVSHELSFPDISPVTRFTHTLAQLLIHSVNIKHLR